MTNYFRLFLILISLSVFLSKEAKGLELIFRPGNVAPFATSLFTITVEEMILGASLVELTSQVSRSAEDFKAVSLSSLLEDELLYREVYVETGEQVLAALGYLSKYADHLEETP